MNLYIVYFKYGEHEVESELFASDSGTHADARALLMHIYGGEGEYMDDEAQLYIEGVQPFDTVHASNGDPYQVTIKQ